MLKSRVDEMPFPGISEKFYAVIFGGFVLVVMGQHIVLPQGRPGHQHHDLIPQSVTLS